MNTINGSEPAFPTMYENSNNTKGMSIREYFAAMAMQGLLANNIYHNPNEKSNMVSVPNLAKAATDYADALILELNKQK